MNYRIGSKILYGVFLVCIVVYILNDKENILNYDFKSDGVRISFISMSRNMHIFSYNINMGG